MKYAIATLKAAAEGEPFDFISVLSTASLDRDREILDLGALDPLPARIPIDIDHALSVEKTIGSGVPYYDGDQLMIKGSFASTPLAQTVHTLVREGHISAMSVAVHGSKKEQGEDGHVHIKSGELVNAAIVAIPANRDALMTVVKSMTEDLAEVAAATVIEVEAPLTPDEIKAVRAHFAQKAPAIQIDIDTAPAIRGLSVRSQVLLAEALAAEALLA